MASYRNTIICSTGFAAYQFQGLQNIEVDGDLIVTNDSDGWYLTIGQSIPTGCSIGEGAIKRVALSDTATQAATFDANWNVLPTVSLFTYGTYGATIA